VINYIQAFLLTFLDKLILATLSIQVLIFYLGVIRTKFYFDHEKLLFFISLITNIIICSVLSIIYIVFSEDHIRKPNGRYFYYCDKYEHKTLIDTIFNTVYLIISLYCSVILLIYLSGKKKQAAEGKIDDLDYDHNFIRTLILFFLTIIAFLESFLIIYDILRGIATEILYLGICIVIDLFNSYNKIILKETLRIFCGKNDERVTDVAMKIENDDDHSEDDGEERDSARTESY
jgi:hypothetical protein